MGPRPDLEMFQGKKSLGTILGPMTPEKGQVIGRGRITGWAWPPPGTSLAEDQLITLEPNADAGFDLKVDGTRFAELEKKTDKNGYAYLIGSANLPFDCKVLVFQLKDKTKKWYRQGHRSFVKLSGMPTELWEDDVPVIQVETRGEEKPFGTSEPERAPF